MAEHLQLLLFFCFSFFCQKKSCFKNEVANMPVKVGMFAKSQSGIGILLLFSLLPSVKC